jgi:hypothetical protein
MACALVRIALCAKFTTECVLAGIALCAKLIWSWSQVDPFRWETREFMSFPQEGLTASLTHPCRCTIRRLWLQLFFVLLPIVPKMMVLIELS